MLKMEVGALNKLPHYSVIGTRVDFYVWVNEDGKGLASKRIKGNYAFTLFNELTNLFKKDKNQFIQRIKQEYFGKKLTSEFVGKE
jgi:hypothetical protein